MQNMKAQYISNQPGPAISPKKYQIDRVIQNFDHQFNKQLEQHIKLLQTQKINIKIKFEQLLREDCSYIQQFTEGQIPLKKQLFQSMNNSLKNQNNKNRVSVNIDFTKYLDQIGIPDFMRDLLKKFKFDSDEFENVDFQRLHEEDREKSLIFGQKDNKNNQFSGRALIIYKTNLAAIYLGYLKKNKRHGKGIIVLNGFQYYCGEFYDNKEWGYGEMQFINKDYNKEKFVGYFSEGRRCGQGQSFIFDDTNKQEITHEFVNQFNDTLHGPRVVQVSPSQKYNFELFQYEQNYFSFKDKWSDKASLQNISVTILGITEAQALNKCHDLSIDSSFKKKQFFSEENPNQIPYNYQNPPNQYPKQLNVTPLEQIQVQ
ncbi:hypothetical protein ABPG72_008215 [Tetrahymena utriculariae]